MMSLRFPLSEMTSLRFPLSKMTSLRFTKQIDDPSLPTDSSPALRFARALRPRRYVYLDSTRPDSSCTSLEDTGVDHTCETFSVPSDAGSCPGYDEYKFGLDLSGTTDSVYMDPFDDESELERVWM